MPLQSLKRISQKAFECIVFELRTLQNASKMVCYMYRSLPKFFVVCCLTDLLSLVACRLSLVACRLSVVCCLLSLVVVVVAALPSLHVSALCSCETPTTRFRFCCCFCVEGTGESVDESDPRCHDDGGPTRGTI